MNHPTLSKLKEREREARETSYKHMRQRDEALLNDDLVIAKREHLKYQEYQQEAALLSGLAARFCYLKQGGQ